MRLFKSIMKPEDMHSGVLNYTPKSIIYEVPKQILPFLKDQKEDNAPPFILSQMTSDHTGLSELERIAFQDKIETGVLEKLKTVEEKAYAEAYALGLADGEKKAFTEGKDSINTALQSLMQIGESLTRVKTDLITQNEAHLIKTLFHIAQALAMKAIREDESNILAVLKKAVESAQAEEEVTIKLNPSDQAFLEKVKSESGHPLERIQKVKLEVNESITRGGCIVETNYGAIDATVEQRVSKLWQTLEAKIPKVQSVA
jgi:flagellar assembly protein FliH